MDATEEMWIRSGGNISFFGPVKKLRVIIYWSFCQVDMHKLASLSHHSA